MGTLQRAGIVRAVDVELPASGRAGQAAARLLALAPLPVLIVALDVYCLIDLARAKSVRNAPKVVWAIVILFVSAPIGALIYLFAGRDPDRGRDAGRREAGAGPDAREAPRHSGQPPADCQPIVVTS